MNAHHMFVKISFSGRSVFTMGAGMWLITCVCSFMSLKYEEMKLMSSRQNGMEENKGLALPVT